MPRQGIAPRGIPAVGGSWGAAAAKAPSARAAAATKAAGGTRVAAASGGGGGASSVGRKISQTSKVAGSKGVCICRIISNWLSNYFLFSYLQIVNKIYGKIVFKHKIFCTTKEYKNCV